MSRETADDILRGFLAINAMLRDELALVRRTLARRNGERKYNPNWPSQPRAPKGVPEGGQWVDGGGISKKPPNIPKNRGGARRPGIGHNRPPPDSLKEIFPGVQHAAPSAILAPVDDFLGISRPGLAANEAATRNVADNLIADIQRLDPSYQPPASAEPGGFPNTIEGRNNYLDILRQDRAAAIYRSTGDAGPLQVETLRLLQRNVDEAYAEGVRLYETGRIRGTLSREQAIGVYVDSTVRQEATRFFHRLGISTESGEPVRINRRAFNSADRTYRIPDLRVDRVAFDMTIWRKPPSYPQIRDVFRSDFRPIAFVVVGPSQLGPGSTYVITPPAARGE